MANVRYRGIDARAWSLSGDYLVASGILRADQGYYLILNPTVIQELGGSPSTTIAAATIATSALRQNTLEPLRPAAEFAGSNWVSKGWSDPASAFATFQNEIYNWIISNLDNATINCGALDFNFYSLDTTIGGTRYSVPLVYLGSDGVPLGRSVPATGLSLFYDFTRSSCYPGSGTTVFDLSPNAFNGTLTNSPSYTTAKGGEFTFTGSQYIDLPLTLANTFSTNKVTLFTTYTTSAVVSKPCAVSFNGNYNFFYPGNRLTGSSVIEQLYWSSGAWSGSTKKDYVLNAWYTMAWTIDVTALNFFVNNAANGSNTVPLFAPPSNTASRIGLANSGEYHVGKIQMLALYNRILTNSELTDLHTRFAVV